MFYEVILMGNTTTRIDIRKCMFDTLINIADK